jgi:hypothetical protein
VHDTICALSASSIPLYLFHDGPDGTPLPAAWVAASRAVIAQQGDSIGDRMSAAFHLLLSKGLREVAVVGSDIPGMDSQLITAAFHAFASHDAAIVPAVDGGYCLIALNKNSYGNDIFSDIAWSSDSVLASTLQRMDRRGIRVKLLPSRRDIDTLEDLEAYCRYPSGSARATNEYLRLSGYLPAFEIRASDPRVRIDLSGFPTNGQSDHAGDTHLKVMQKCRYLAPSPTPSFPFSPERQ